MRTLLRLLVLAAVVVPLPAAAAVLTSGALLAGNGFQLACVVVNVATKPVTVEMSLLHAETGANLAVVNSCGTIPPGRSCSIASGTSGLKLGYCTVRSSSAKIRGSLVTYGGPDLNPTAALPLTK